LPKKAPNDYHQRLFCFCHSTDKWTLKSVVGERVVGVAASLDPPARYAHGVELDQLGRSLKDLVTLVSWFQQQGVHFVSL
jgi:hypothetical protein